MMIQREKKILIHSIVFSPDGVSTAYLYNDIALAFRDSGYEVVVITTTPHYNIVKSALEQQPLRKRAAGLYYKSEFHGIPVYHVPQKKFKSFLARASGFVFWHIVSFILGISQKDISLILSPSPPLTIGLVSILIAQVKRAKVVYNVQEIYPDLLVNQGSLKSPLLLTLLKRMERFVYNRSDKVVTIDEIFYASIVSRFKNPDKLIVIPNFVDTDIYKPDIRSENLLDKTLFPDTSNLKVMYAGNIGHAQDWEPLIAIARKMKGQSVDFWVVGEGVLKKYLQCEIKKNGLNNIHLLPYQSREKITAIINYADIHFIFMNPLMEGQGFPSKVYTIMACQKPLLIASGKNTPLYHFLQDKECSFLVSENDFDLKIDKIAAALNAYIHNRSALNEMGKRSASIINDHYSKNVVTAQYVSLGNALTNI